MSIRSLVHLFTCSLVLALVSCDGTKFLMDDELLLTHVKVNSTDPSLSVSGMMSYVKQTPNTKWFSALKVPLGIYCLSGRDTTKAVNRRLRKWGEAPVILDSTKIAESSLSITKAMQNMGYLDAEVLTSEKVRKKRVRVLYTIVPNRTYTIRHIRYNIADHNIDSLLHTTNLLAKGMYEGSTFSINALHTKRNEITAWLNDNGYMYFNKEAITFQMDSSRTTRLVDVTMNLGLYRRSSREPLHEHPRYTISKVTYSMDKTSPLTGRLGDGGIGNTSPLTGRLGDGGIGNTSPLTGGLGGILHQRILDISTVMREGDLYSASKVQKTYNKFARLQAVRSTNIHFDEVTDSLAATDSLNLPLYNATSRIAPHQLNATIQLSQRKKHSIQIQPEGTNTAGDFGAALSLTYENRNVFHGSQVFSLQARGAYEAIKGLEGYDDSNYIEYNIEGKLTFPEFVIPGISRDYQRRHNATSEIIISYNRQNRPEFQRRVLTAGWRYRWQATASRIGYQYDFVDVNYVSMPWISDTFKKDYLESGTNANAILKYNYENLLIMKTSFGITYTDASNSLKVSVETAGNTLFGAAHLFNFSRNDDGKYKFALVAFAQYVKVDADYTHLFRLDTRNTLALHARIGVAVPYGNSDMLPYEKRYFAGGANSVRGWSVRQLGPGSFKGMDGRIDFINQTGDMRLDLNAELRTKLFWKFAGAFFIDAGNIWTLRQYKDQPGGQFTLRSLYDEMAVAYGLGLRLNFDYFVLRLDLGMKAVNPNYTTSYEHFPIIHPKFSRDYALHFAVGLPF